MKERAPGSSMIGARQCGTDSGAPCYSENLFAEYPESGTALRQVEPLRQFGNVPAFDLFRDARQNPRACEDAVGRGPQRRIVKKILQAELFAEGLPVTLGHHADEDALLARGIEDVVDRPGMLALRHRARLVAGHLVFNHVLGDEKQAVLE